MDNAKAATETRKLPTIEDLYNEENLEENIKQNALNYLLNQAPNPKWLKANKNLMRTVNTPQGEQKVPIVYIPIERIEWLLTKIFINWHVEILNVQQIQNSIVCTVRLFYQNPITSELLHMDGVGAMPIQTKSGKAANDMAEITTQAIQLAAPAAESYAVKDAAEKIGKIFGKDMNRADELGYDALMTTFTENKKEVWLEKLDNALNLCQDAGMVEAARKDLAQLEQMGVLDIDTIKNFIKKFER